MDVIYGSAVSGPVNASALLVACLVRGDTAPQARLQNNDVSMTFSSLRAPPTEVSFCACAKKHVEYLAPVNRQ